MAYLPRGRFSRLFTLAVRSRASLPSCSSLSSWRHLSAVSSAPQSAGGCYSWRQRQLLLSAGQRRCYSGGSGGIASAELEERVLNVLKLFDKIKAEKVSLEAHFMNDLGMDSLDAVEVVMAFEDEFGVEISDEEAEKVLSCKDAIALLKTKLDVH